MPVTRISIREGKTPAYKQAIMDEILVFWAAGKTVDAKLAMYKKIVERLSTNPGVRPEDVMIAVVETAAENWSFGNGETQFYKVPARDGARA
jgi:phenylpyruvate tautomerase PptA (4-oxalocrotonate tautomerase family)